MEINQQKRGPGRPTEINEQDIFCLRAFVLHRRTMQSIADELQVSRQRVCQRLRKFGVKRGRAVARIGKPELAARYLGDANDIPPA